MTMRKGMIFTLFLVFPLIGIAFDLFASSLSLSLWDYISAVLSIAVCCSIMAEKRKLFNLLATALLVAILAEDLFVIDNSYFVLTATYMIYKFILAIAIYHFILKPEVENF